MFLTIYIFKINKTENFNTIFGIISNLHIDYTNNFFKSLQKVQYDGRIIVFTDKNENKKYYNNLKIEYIIFSYTYPYYPVDSHLYNINISFINKIYPDFTKIKKNNIFFLWILRYYLFYSFIYFYGTDRDIYLFSDIKDVIFQSNPFNWKFKKGVYLVEESKIKSLKDASFEWMKLYTTNDKLLQNRVINGGIIFGSSIEMKLFLKEFLNGYNNEGKNGVDQAYLNYFFYKKNYFNYPVNVCESDKCFCKCIIQEILYTTENIINETDMIIYNSDRSIPCLIHQYTYIYVKKLRYRNELFQKYIKYLTE